MVISEITLIILTVLEIYYQADTSSGKDGKLKTALRGVAVIIFFIIIMSKDGIDSHPIATFIAYVVYSISLFYFGTISIIFHGK